MEKISNDDQEWIDKENKAFRESINCYRMILGNKEFAFQAIGPNGTMRLLEKMAKKIKGSKLVMNIIANPKTYIKSTTINPLIPYGYWTCKCDEEFVRTNFLSTCPKCGCNIADHTKKAKYIEDCTLI